METDNARFRRFLAEQFEKHRPPDTDVSVRTRFFGNMETLPRRLIFYTAEGKWWRRTNVRADDARFSMTSKRGVYVHAGAADAFIQQMRDEGLKVYAPHNPTPEEQAAAFEEARRIMDASAAPRRPRLRLVPRPDEVN